MCARQRGGGGALPGWTAGGCGRDVSVTFPPPGPPASPAGGLQSHALFPKEQRPLGLGPTFRGLNRPAGLGPGRVSREGGPGRHSVPPYDSLPLPRCREAQPATQGRVPAGIYTDRAGTVLQGGTPAHKLLGGVSVAAFVLGNPPPEGVPGEPGQKEEGGTRAGGGAPEQAPEEPGMGAPNVNLGGSQSEDKRRHQAHLGPPPPPPTWMRPLGRHPRWAGQPAGPGGCDSAFSE